MKLIDQPPRLVQLLAVLALYVLSWRVAQLNFVGKGAGGKRIPRPENPTDELSGPGGPGGPGGAGGAGGDSAAAAAEVARMRAREAAVLLAEHELQAAQAELDADRHRFLRDNATLAAKLAKLSQLQQRSRGGGGDDPALPWLYMLTPTYRRHTQKADLVRMANTLRQVPNLHWIVIEDADAKTRLVTRFLQTCGVAHLTHLVQRTPKSMQRKICKWVDPRIGCPQWRLGKEAELWTQPRGVEQRNAGLAALRALRPTNGVFYFADDDNSFSLDLFDTIRKVRRVGVWTVALSGGLVHEGPLVKNGVVVDFHVGWRPDRPFPIDMASFAVNVNELTRRPHVKFDATAERGFLESAFLLNFIKDKSEMEPYDYDNCDGKPCVKVWHTKTQEPDLKAEKVSKSDPAVEV